MLVSHTPFSCPEPAAAMTLATATAPTPAVADCWHTLTVTAQTDAEARKAAAECARAINTAGVTSLRVSEQFGSLLWCCAMPNHVMD